VVQEQTGLLRQPAPQVQTAVLFLAVRAEVVVVAQSPLLRQEPLVVRVVRTVEEAAGEVAELMRVLAVVEAQVVMARSTSGPGDLC